MITNLFIYINKKQKRLKSGKNVNITMMSGMCQNTCNTTDKNKVNIMTLKVSQMRHEKQQQFDKLITSKAIYKRREEY